MTLGIPFQRVHDLKALGVHQLLGLGALFGIEAGNRRLIVDHLTRQHPVFKVQRAACSINVCACATVVPWSSANRNLG